MPRRMLIATLFIALAVTPAARATVADSSPSGFTIKHTLHLSAPPQMAYPAFTKLASWWDPEHTYSGKSTNLTLEAKPNGCFCEKLGAGGIVHMAVVYAEPNKILRLGGGLGPLQELGVSGSMTLKFKPVDPAGTDVEFTYAVGGYSAQGLDKLAQIVDQVLVHQLDRYQRFVTSGKPEGLK